MTIRQISQEILSEANRHSAERMKYEYNRFRLSEEQRRSMILIGTIGQLLFKEYLEESNVNFNFEYQAGNYDEMDFSINNEIVEIKTSGYDHNGYRHLNILYAEDQFQAGLRKDFIYCVQIFINGYSRKTKILSLDQCDTGVIAGYIPFAEISNFPGPKRYYGDDYKVPISALSDISNLLKNEQH